MPLTTETTRSAAAPVVPWQAPLAGLLSGFLLALLPATFVARVLPSQLPFVARQDRLTTALVALVLAGCAGLATAVCCAARELRS